MLTLIPFCDSSAAADLVKVIADRNPNKFGLYTAGSKIQVISEEESRKMKPDYYFHL